MPDLLKVRYLYSIAGSNIYFGEIAITISALCFFAHLNIKGIKLASQFQNIMVLILVGIVLLFLCLALSKTGFSSPNTLSFISDAPINLVNILTALSISPALFIGFDCISQVPEELKFKASEASTLAMFSIVMGALIYCSILLFTSFGLSFEELTSGKIAWATGHTVEFYFGKIGLWSLGIALLSAIIAGINGFYMAASRLLFAMARGKIQPDYFGVLDRKYHPPKNAIIFILIVSLIAPWFGRNVLAWIVGTTSFGAAIAYLYTSLAVLKLYKQENNKLFLPAIFGSIAGVIFLLLIIPGLKSTLSLPSAIIVIAWAAIGYAFYRFYDLKVMHYSKEKLDEFVLNRYVKK